MVRSKDLDKTIHGKHKELEAEVHPLGNTARTLDQAQFIYKAPIKQAKDNLKDEI